MRASTCRALARAVTVTGAATAAVTLLGAAPASAAPAPDYEMPFACGQEWTGSTRARHSPSANAIDFNRPDDLGQITVSAAQGTVTRVADLGDESYGRYVIVDHGDGDQTLFAHLQSVWVTQGQRVDQGSIIGRVGTTGGSSGPHLHFEERHDGKVVAPWFHDQAFVMGSTLASANCSDTPVAGDWDGDGVDEVGVFRRTKVAKFRLAQDDAPAVVVRFGRSTDVPVAGDWDGDGTTDVGVRRPGWRAFLLRQPDGTTSEVKLGRVVDTPLTGDWDGDGLTDLGVWAPASATFTLRLADGSLRSVPLGDVDDQPVTGDWNGDGATDVGVFDPSSALFTLRSEPGDGSVTTTTLVFGAPGDLPVAGDWDGNGVADVGTWAPESATYSLRVTPVRARTTATVTTLRFGRAR